MLNSSTTPLPDQTLLDCTAQAWNYVQECLPHLLALYDEPYWDPNTGSGLCAHAAAWLQHLLRQEGKTSTLALVQGNIISHCFVLCEGFVLDPTAMQFGSKTPTVTWYDAEHAPWYHQQPTLHVDVPSLCQHLQDLGWCDAQVPLYFLDGVQIESGDAGNNLQNQ